MMNENTKNNQLLVVVAVAAAVVALIAVGVLAINYVKFAVVETERQDNLAELKAIVTNQPNNTALIEHLQQKDLEFRKGYFARQKMNRKAGVLLLLSIAVLIGVVKYGWPVKQVLPEKESGDVSLQQVSNAALARNVIVGVGVLLAVAAVGITIKSTVSKPAEIELMDNSEVSPYPTMEEVHQNWPGFRGPEGSGMSAFMNVPETFDVESGTNVIFKSPVAKHGNSSPIVWGDKVFMSGGDDESRVVMCYDGNTGDLLWSKPVHFPGAPETLDIMEDTGYAACTPVTDGQRVYAIFATGEIIAFDFDGNKVWDQFLGVPESMYGYASSLAIYQNTVIIQFDQGYEPGYSVLLGVNGLTGDLLWQTSRDVPNSWTSPIVAKIGESYQVITVADPYVSGYNPVDGLPIWSVEAAAGDVAPLPIVSGGIVYAVEPDYAVWAVKPVEKGAGSEAEVLWSVEDGAGDIASPACDGERIYITSGGRLTCISIANKEVLWDHYFDDNFLASPSIVGDKVYLLDGKGKLTVIKCGDALEQLSVSELGEECFASPAFVDGKMYIRSKENLYCIGSK